MKIKQRETGRQGVMRACLDLLEAERIRHWRMNAGDRFGSYTSKRTGKTKKWRIRGQEEGTWDTFISMRFLLGGLRPIPVWIEYKATGKNLTAEQLQFKKEAEANGEICVLVDDPKQLQDWIKDNRASWDMKDKPRKIPEDWENLKSAIVKLVEESPCSYEEVIAILHKEIKWLQRARKQEHGRKSIQPSKI